MDKKYFIVALSFFLAISFFSVPSFSQNLNDVQKKQGAESAMGELDSDSSLDEFEKEAAKDAKDGKNKDVKAKANKAFNELDKSNENEPAEKSQEADKPKTSENHEQAPVTEKKSPKLD